MTIKKALLLGLNYNNTANQLNGCINDVLNVSAFLTSCCGFAPEKIQLLTDQTDLKPTKSNIQTQILEFTKNVVSGDVLVFHYSGHGSYVQDTNGDETDKRDEVLVPLDYTRTGFITDDWLYENLVMKVPAGVNLIAFLDCCHSGTGFDLRFNYKSLCRPKFIADKMSTEYKATEWTDVFSFSIEKSLGLVAGNVIMFSGCLDPQTSADAYIANQAQGAFTNALLKVLKTNVITLENGDKRFQNGTLKVRNILKGVNCILRMGQFSQSSQLCLSIQSNFENFLFL